MPWHLDLELPFWADRQRPGEQYLNTIWGDRGHQDYESACYLPVAYGAAVSWAVEENRELDSRPFLNQVFFRDGNGLIGGLLYDLGNVYQLTGRVPHNGSLLVYLFHMGMDRPQLLEGITAEDLERARAIMKDLEVRIGSVAIAGEEGQLVLREMRNGVHMLLHACALGQLRLALSGGEPVDRTQVRALALELDEIMAEHRDLWLQRNRIGGLEEMSLEPLRRLLSEYERRMETPAE